MSSILTDDYAIGIVDELRKLPVETEWVEFKHNNAEPEKIGRYISALSNSSALIGKTKGYLVWGIENFTHEVVGTSFAPTTFTVGNEVLENWLLRLLEPKVAFQFKEVAIEEKHVVVLAIDRAFRSPTRFKNEAYVRLGSVLKQLKDVGPKERELWRVLDETPFESMVATERVNSDRVLRLLDYPSYFNLLDLPLPIGRDGIISAFVNDGLILPSEAGGWDITNLAAALFAVDVAAFGAMGRKAMRVVEYRGNTRVETIKEQVGQRGYASGFAGLIGYINDRLPRRKEQIGQALRHQAPMYPELAVRELVANALIHQDFPMTGTGPMVEIFEDRIEITNPGKPLIETERFLDTPPRSRNEGLASLMRRMGICEERGTGIDKVVFQTEMYQLPAPIFEASGDNMRVSLLSPRPLAAMGPDDRVRACYLHACLKYVEREFLTNSSLRDRFGIAKKNSAHASRLIKEAVDANMIHPYDPNSAPKMMKYVPYWA